MDRKSVGTMGIEEGGDSGVRLWPVSLLLKAIAGSLEARFNPVAVQGEISGFSRAASGHCYFSLKDNDGQIRCAMFRRASVLLDFSPRDGQRVELRGRLGVYEARGELQLIVESMRQAGQGTLFEQFLKLKAKLESEGLFNPDHKRDVPLMPKAIGVVTSLNAAALHDVVTALQRRVPHIPVIIYPASVQGAQAAGELCDALSKAFARQEVDVLLLVRGGGVWKICGLLTMKLWPALLFRRLFLSSVGLGMKRISPLLIFVQMCGLPRQQRQLSFAHSRSPFGWAYWQTWLHACKMA